jgi:hypothetical protein
MGEKKEDEHRYFPRYHAVAEKFDGQLLVVETNEPFAGKIVDVSRDGAGVLSTQQIEPGSHLVLKFAGKNISFVVRHCQSDLIFKGKYRVGLMRIGSTKENLLQLFLRYGFVAD